MSFAAKVAALRSFMGVPDDAPLPLAVEMMNHGAPSGTRMGNEYNIFNFNGC